MKFYDTNALLNLQDKIFEERFIISSISLLELENIKTSANKDEDVKFRARHISRQLLENKDKYKVAFLINYIKEELENRNLPLTNDNLICACAQNYDRAIKEGCFKDTTSLEFVSDDVLCSLVAENLFGLKTSRCNADNKNSEIYKGYRVVTPTDEELATVYEKDNSENVFECNINEYVVVNDSEDNFCDVLKWTGSKYVAVWNKNLKTMAFGDKIKAKDVYQRMAIDSLMTNQMTCISGKAGSGKSLLSLLAAMYLIETGKYDRLVVLFNPCSVRGAKELGFYAGDMVEKAMQSNIGNVLITKFGDRFALDNYINQNKIKLVAMADCRGMEIRDNEILWITESENTTSDLMKICLSRVSSNAKVIIEGDYNQIDNKVFERNNGMLRAVEVLTGEKEFGYVQLQNVWRSRIAELTDKF